MIPIYTTDSVPIAGSGPVVQAWPVWADESEIGPALDRLAHTAMGRGAHAIIGLKVSSFWTNGRREKTIVEHARHVLVGTAVILGDPSPALGQS